MRQPPTLDKEALFRNLRREGTPSRVFLFEHAIDDAIKNGLVQRFSLDSNLNSSDPAFPWECDVAIHRFLGMELFRIRLPGAAFSVQTNQWIDEHWGPIREPEDMATYDWPEVSKVDFSQLDWFEKHLPEDMGVVHAFDVFEVVRDLMGYEAMCIALFDRPEFVEEVCARVGGCCRSIVEYLCSYRCVAAIYGCDDFGFKTSLLIDPATIRRLFLPWHRQFSEDAHRSDKLFLVHSCGKLDEIMDDIIDDVRADAKHSFEDVITPVTEAKRLWGNRISLLGGLDVDFMARSDEEAIRRRVRDVLDICMPGGGYCLGLGNWVTSYIPMANYLAMVDEARAYC